MTGVEYCTILPSWDFDKDPACIIRYYFGQDSGQPTEDSDLGDGEITQHAEGVDIRNCLELSCPDCGEDGNVEACTLTVTCKSQYRVSICGVHVISQTRFVEIYDTGEVYISTARGSRVQSQEDGEGGEDTQFLYKSRAKLDDNLYGIVIKFPKVSGLKSLTIYQISLILHPESEEDTAALSSKDLGMIDLDKVKGYIGDLGDNIPDGARDLMNTMEEYQRNQKREMSGFPGMGAFSSTASSSMGMRGLLSVFTQLNRPSPQRESVKQNNSDDNRAPPRLNVDMSNFSKLLQTNPGTENSAESKDNGLGDENGEMYNLLHNICGKVTKMRERSTHSEEEKAEGTGTVSGAKISDLPSNQESVLMPNSERVPNLTASDFEKIMKETETRLQEHIDKRLTEIEERLTLRLDSVLTFLQKYERGTVESQTDS